MDINCRRIIFLLNKVLAEPVFTEIMEDYSPGEDELFSHYFQIITGLSLDEELKPDCVKSVFAGINLTDKKHKKESEFYLKAQPVTGINIPGPEKNDKKQIEDLLAELHNKMVSLSRKDISCYRLLLLVEKYLSNLTLRSRNTGDISLFDLLKTVLAICNSFASSPVTEREENPLYLAGGDFSGLQNFIYTLTSKGALKNLRSRSFFLELLTEHVVTLILTNLDLPRTNLIFSGGGRFYILTGSTAETKEKLIKLRNKINDWLFTNFRGKLFLALEGVSFGADYLGPNPEKSFSGAWQKVGRKLERAKKQKFSRRLRERDDMLAPFTPPAEEECSVCKRLTEDLHTPGDDPETVLCSFCYSLYKAGQDLSWTGYIAASSEITNTDDNAIRIMDKVYYLCSDYSEINEINNVETIYVLNSFAGEDYSDDRCVKFLLGNYSAVHNGQNKDFDDFAREARGVNRIGVLRMDVDNLGKIFLKGFAPGARTLSRISALSRQLNLFFKYYINLIAGGEIAGFKRFSITDKTGPRNVALVYSGGDDLFIVGSWDEIIEISFDINRIFTEYTAGNNDDISISGGIVVHKPRKPIYRLAELAGEAEEKAKSAGRSRISLFYNSVKNRAGEKSEYILTWEQAQGLIDKLVAPLAGGLGEVNTAENRLELKIPHSFFNKLLQIIDKWDESGVLYLPMMAYNIGRMEESLQKRKDFNSYKSSWFDLKNRLMNQKYISRLYLALNWVELLHRKGDN